MSCGHLCVSHQPQVGGKSAVLRSDVPVRVPRIGCPHPRKVSKLPMCCRHSKGPGGRRGRRADRPGWQQDTMQKEPASTAESSRDLDQRQAAVLQRTGPGGSLLGRRGGARP